MKLFYPFQGIDFEDVPNIRDWFAGMAMQALLQFGTYGVEEKDGAAEWAYKIADAMIKERENNE